MKKLKIVLLCILSLALYSNNNQAGNIAPDYLKDSVLSNINGYDAYSIKVDSLYTSEANLKDEKIYWLWAKRSNAESVKSWGSIVSRKQDHIDNNIFKKRIGKFESCNTWNPKSSPKSQFWGRYQIGQSVRIQLGIFGINRKSFVEDTILQESTMNILMKLNRITMRRHIRKYNGKTVNGYPLTESGLLAMAHHMGANAIMNWLDSGCVDTLKDSNNKLTIDYLYACNGLKLKF